MASPLAAARHELHRRMIADRIIGVRPKRRASSPDVINIADSDNVGSKRVSALFAGLLERDTGLAVGAASSADDPGSSFEVLVRDFVATTLTAVEPSIPWGVRVGGSISSYAQYHHLEELKRLSDDYEELRIHLGSGYIIKPDVVVYRDPLGDPALARLIEPDDPFATSTFLRQRNADPALPILHASVSCKWTLRSDRAQNARTEALNLIRNRKGRAPGITVVTAEPMPSRLASLADGTGDVDRVYHIGLPELTEAVEAYVAERPRMGHWATDLSRMVRGKRLADISDLPFDLLI
jgi:NgoMIV restriction enzyme